jgi:hypothetical protein
MTTRKKTSRTISAYLSHDAIVTLTECLARLPGFASRNRVLATALTIGLLELDRCASVDEALARAGGK